ncbi:DUF4363 family protein [Virgibacillus phasianinus]|nr:DUF4363 family protein [Virgibacillus phasianinus]
MMKFTKLPILICLLISLLVLGGCKSENVFYEKINDINESVSHSNWKQTKEGVKKLSNMYKEKEWKLQLLGDEAEYEGINVELEVLKESADAKDKTQVKVALGTIRGHLKDIFSF